MPAKSSRRVFTPLSRTSNRDACRGRLAHKDLEAWLWERPPLKVPEEKLHFLGTCPSFTRRS